MSATLVLTDILAQYCTHGRITGVAELQALIAGPLLVRILRAVGFAFTSRTDDSAGTKHKQEPDDQKDDK